MLSNRPQGSTGEIRGRKEQPEVDRHGGGKAERGLRDAGPDVEQTRDGGGNADAHPGRCGGGLRDGVLGALRRVHTAMAARHRRPYFDGGYVTWHDLTGDPALAGPGADAHEGRLTPRPAGWCDPVTWHTLAGHGVTVFGRRREDVPVWTDRKALAAWTRRNLDHYWRPWLRRSSRLWSRPGLACVHNWGPVWGVLGVSRLHYTLATGAITAKYGAGLYARNTFPPPRRRIVDECLRLRRGDARQPGGEPGYRNPLHRRRDALDFVAMAIDDAHRIS